MTSESHPQPSLFGDVQPSRAFDGVTYDPKRDRERLTTALEVVRSIMADGQWRTLHDIQQLAHKRHRKHITEASVSARLRDLRKPKYGGLTVERRRHPKCDGLWLYRLPTGSESQ